MTCPTRLNIGIMLFVSTLTLYVIRVNMSITILGMANSANHSTELPDYGPRYNWTVAEQSLLLGSYFWGYIITQFPSGVLSEWYGGRVVLGYSLGLSGIITFFTPMAANLFSFWAVLVLRVITGAFGGAVFPAMQNVIAKWAPPNEKGKFSFTVFGGTFGTVITWPIIGYLMEKCGWAYGFYVPAVFTIIVTFIWFATVYNTPADHPRISIEEQEYIARELGNNVAAKTKGLPPLLCLLKSVPFWALLFLQYGNLWAFYFLLTGAPKYMNEVLKFNLAKAGIWASLPYLCRVTAGYVFGSIGDYLTKNKVFSVTFIRKSFCIFSHIIPGILLFAIGYVGESPAACVALISIAFGFNGASSVTNLQNVHDFAPNYAATIFSLANIFGTTSGFVAPLVVAFFTREKNTVVEWNYIFLIASIFYILPALFFILFGSTKIQPWNDLNYRKKLRLENRLRYTDEQSL